MIFFNQLWQWIIPSLLLNSILIQASSVFMEMRAAIQVD